MGLLGDFLLGAVTNGGRDILNRTLEEDRRREELARREAEYQRKRTDDEADYERRRKATFEDADRIEAARLKRQVEHDAAIEKRKLATAREGAAALTVAGSPGLLRSELDAVREGKNPFTTASGEDREGNPIQVPDDKRFIEVMGTYNKALAKTMTGASSDDIAKSKQMDKVNALIDDGKHDEAAALVRTLKGEGDVAINGGVIHNRRTGEVRAAPTAERGVTDAQWLTHSQAVISAAGQRLAAIERDAASLRNNIKEQQRNLAAAGAKDRPAIQEQIESASAELQRLQTDWQTQKRYYDEALAAQNQLRAGGGRPGVAPAAGPGLMNGAQSPMDMAKAEAVSSGQPVEFNLGGRTGTLEGGTGAERGAAPAPKPAAVKVEKRGEVFLPKSAAEYDSLPPGALYEKNGKTYRKKG